MQPILQSQPLAHDALVISASGPASSNLDITTPSNPTAVSAAITDPGNGYTQLDGTTSIDTITVDSRTYALVTSNYGSPNGGFEIIDITTPSSPYSVLGILDGQKGYHNVLNGLDVESVMSMITPSSFRDVTRHKLMSQWYVTIDDGKSSVV